MKSSNRKFWVVNTATLALVLIVLVSVIAVVNKQEPGAAHQSLNQSLNQRGSTVEPMMGGGLYAPVETFCNMGTCPI